MPLTRPVIALAIAAIALTATTACSSATPASKPDSGTKATIGGLTVAFTKPDVISGHATASVKCSTADGYSATVKGVEVGGSAVDFKVTIETYKKPGKYDSNVDASVTPDGGATTTVSDILGVSAAVTSDGGSLALDGTNAAGQPIQGSFFWTCDK